MNNHQYLFYFTKDYQECYEEWENGKLIHSKVTALGTAMFELLSFDKPPLRQTGPIPACLFFFSRPHRSADR